MSGLEDRPMRGWGLRDRNGLVLAPRIDRPAHLGAYPVMNFASRAEARDYAAKHFAPYCRPKPVQLAIQILEVAQ